MNYILSSSFIEGGEEEEQEFDILSLWSLDRNDSDNNGNNGNNTTPSYPSTTNLTSMTNSNTFSQEPGLTKSTLETYSQQLVLSSSTCHCCCSLHTLQHPIDRWFEDRDDILFFLTFARSSPSFQSPSPPDSLDAIESKSSNSLLTGSLSPDSMHVEISNGTSILPDDSGGGEGSGSTVMMTMMTPSPRSLFTVASSSSVSPFNDDNNDNNGNDRSSFLDFIGTWCGSDGGDGGDNGGCGC